VPDPVFKAFVRWLQNPSETELPVTDDKAVPLSQLAAEFKLDGLRQDCADARISVLSDRISELDAQVSDLLRRSDQRDPPRSPLSSKPWTISGSMDGKNWKPIDEKTDAHFTNEELTTPIADPAKARPWRYIILMQTGKNRARHDFLELRAVEFFGTLFPA
jgi:hypothetical protein